jgi:hypothetical protein
MHASSNAKMSELSAITYRKAHNWYSVGDQFEACPVVVSDVLSRRLTKIGLGQFDRSISRSSLLEISWLRGASGAEADVERTRSEDCTIEVQSDSTRCDIVVLVHLAFSHARSFPRASPEPPASFTRASRVLLSRFPRASVEHTASRARRVMCEVSSELPAGFPRASHEVSRLLPAYFPRTSRELPASHTYFHRPSRELHTMLRASIPRALRELRE